MSTAPTGSPGSAFGGARPLPTDAELVVALRSSLGGSHGDDLKLVGRRPNPYQATVPTEIASIRTRGHTQQLFCKYGRDFSQPAAAVADKLGCGLSALHGGVAYEADVYRRCLVPFGAVPQRSWPGYRDPSGGETWLFLEYVPAHESWDQSAVLVPAARWIGELHAAYESGARHDALVQLDRPGPRYYLFWGGELMRNRHSIPLDTEWLETAAARLDEAAGVLSAAGRTLVHGDFYADNALLVAGTLYPVDWSWAAIGAGEMDLAMLVEGWPDAAMEACVQAYAGGRWPAGPAADFERTFAAAQLALAFRLACVPRAWTGTPKQVRRLERLRRYAQQYARPPAPATSTP